MALNGLSNSSSLNFNNLNNSIYNGIRTQETNLRTTMQTIGNQGDGNISQTDMLMLQQQVQQWSMLIEIQSTITKQISDSLKGVIQKAS